MAILLLGMCCVIGTCLDKASILHTACCTREALLPRRAKADASKLAQYLRISKEIVSSPTKTLSGEDEPMSGWESIFGEGVSGDSVVDGINSEYFREMREAEAEHRRDRIARRWLIKAARKSRLRFCPDWTRP